MYLLIELFLNSNYPSPQLDGNKKSQLYEKHLIEELSESGECMEAKLQQAIASFDRFEMSEWHKIAGVFEVIVQAVRLVEAKRAGEKRVEQTFKLKQAAANYIHEQFCDWIFEQGGWVNMDLILLGLL